MGSKSKIELLDKIIDSEESFSVRELARLGGLPKSTVSLIVEEWRKAGLLNSQTIGKTKVIRINKKFALHQILLKLFARSKKNTEEIIAKIKKSRLLQSKGVVCAVVFGSLAKKNISSLSDADILIVIKKKAPKKSPLNSLWQELYGKLPLLPAPVFLTEKQVLGRLKEKDAFIANVFNYGIALKGGKWFDAAKRAFRNSLRTV